MIRILLLAAALLGQPAIAQGPDDPHPALYDIRRPDRPLVARDWPDPTGFRVGEVAAGTGTVEVLTAEPRLGWAMVNVGERTGWVRLSKLRRRPGQWQDHALPEALSCLGTEPGWTLDLAGDSAIVHGLAQPEATFGELTRGRALGRSDRWNLQGSAPEGRMTAVVVRTFCSDGMSDREYRLSIDLILNAGDDQPYHYAGCCSLSR